MTALPPLHSLPAPRSQAPGSAGGTGRLGTHGNAVGCEAGTARAPARPEGRADPDPKEIGVYHARPAGDPVARWTRRLLMPVLQILKTPGHPVEFRPLGCFAGRSPGDVTRDPQQRICISNLILFRSKFRFVTVYVHELAHALIDEAEVKFDPASPAHFHQHDPAFFCLNLYFLRRLDEARFMPESRIDHESWSNSMELYDLQDPPLFYRDSPATQWRPIALSWALETADELMALKLPAEAVALEIVKRYWAWTDSHFLQFEREQEKKQKTLEKRVLEERRLALMKSDLQLFRCLTGVFSLGFLALFYFLVRT